MSNLQTKWPKQISIKRRKTASKSKRKHCKGRSTSIPRPFPCSSLTSCPYKMKADKKIPPSVKKLKALISFRANLRRRLRLSFRTILPLMSSKKVSPRLKSTPSELFSTIELQFITLKHLCPLDTKEGRLHWANTSKSTTVVRAGRDLTAPTGLIKATATIPSPAALNSKRATSRWETRLAAPTWALLSYSRLTPSRKSLQLRHLPLNTAKVSKRMSKCPWQSTTPASLAKHKKWAKVTYKCRIIHRPFKSLEAQRVRTK